MPVARITSFTSPRMDSTGRVDLPWDKPGDALPLRLDVETDDPSKIRAEVWTNADDNASPDRYHAVPMKLASMWSMGASFSIDLPIHHVGNYRAAARVSVDGGQTWRWMSDSGLGDLRFRPRDERHDALQIEEVSVGNVNFDPTTKTPGTFADLMEAGTPLTDGRYTLE
jgi:hypothetical protein